MTEQVDDRHHVVIIGGGFGGLNAAKALRNKPLRVTLVDKRNFHLFQPLLYQVATGGLSPGDIAYPLRAAVHKSANIRVLAAEVIDILPDQRQVVFVDGQLGYDSLIVATGAANHYFGNDHWADLAPGLKTVEDALGIRRRILLAFEAAEREGDPDKRQARLNFVVIGGGPTGVELAGAISGLANETLRHDFQDIDPRDAHVILLEGQDRILGAFPEELSAKAEQSLVQLGIEVRKRTFMTDIQEGCVVVRDEASGETSRLPAYTVLWAAGMKASPIGQVLADQTGAELDRMGRLVVEPDLTLPGHPNIFVIGDLANFAYGLDAPLPGVAQVAMQQGVHAAELILARQRGRELPAFVYKDKGTMAVIGRNAAVADIGRLHISGFPAWLIWLFVHISFLIGFDNKVLVLVQWAWYYLTRKRGARLITGDSPYPLV